jgi:hypothetical protein
MRIHADPDPDTDPDPKPCEKEGNRILKMIKSRGTIKKERKSKLKAFYC